MNNEVSNSSAIAPSTASGQEKTYSPAPRLSEYIVSISAIFISLCALGVSIYEANLERRHQEAEVWPNIEIVTSWNDSGYKLTSINSGIGPAKIQCVRGMLDGKVVNDWRDAFSTVTGQKKFEDISTGTLQNRVLRPGDQLDLFVMPNKKNTEALLKSRRRISLDVYYCSVFDACWYCRMDNMMSRRKIKTVEAKDIPPPPNNSGI